MAATGWQEIRTEALRRIRRGDWKPGERIPDETVLARELGCARATVNRALRDLADAGLLERRRKGGTRVVPHPVRRVTLDIRIVRRDVEDRGQTHGYRLLHDRVTPAPDDVTQRLQRPSGTALRHVLALHLSDGRPYCLEDRWLNPEVAPPATVGFSDISPNEWLVTNLAYTTADLAFWAETADRTLAEHLACAEGAALLVLDRTTWFDTEPITTVRLIYPPGHRMTTNL